MTLVLTQNQLNALQNTIDSTGVEAFYNLLEQYGDSYGRLGAEITRNDTWQGQLANALQKALLQGKV